MKRRVIYGVGIYICIMLMFFMTGFPSHASEERPIVTSVSISPGTVVVTKDATQNLQRL